MIILGIDAGTTQMKAAIPNQSGEPQIITNRMGQTFTPSVVYFAEDGEELVGMEAENAAMAAPGNAVFDWKRNMGTDNVLYSENGNDYRAKDILAILLKSVVADAEAKTGETINEIVVTVPANYTNVQKQQTHEAAQSLGLKVLVTPHEPTAGALGNHIYKLKNATGLVYDLGGGTFDVSIIRVRGNVCEVVATGGIPKLGGRDFNKRIEDIILNEFEDKYGYRPNESEHAVFYQDMKGRVEQAKITLSAQQQCNIVMNCNGDILNMVLTRQQFEKAVSDLVAQSIKQTQATLKDAALTWDDIDVIYPIGGASMMPIVRRELENASGKSVTQNCEAHCAAAMGAVVAARLEYERQGKAYQVGNVTLPPTDHFMHDILSRSVGVLVLTEDDKNVCSEILASQTPIPSIQTKKFSLTHPKQTGALIQILQGKDGQPADECTELGHFELSELPLHNNMTGRIEVTFDIDVNGMLTATARDTVSNKKAQLEIDYNNA